MTQHQARPSRKQLTDNSKVIARADNKFKLLIKEAILIQKLNPSINRQFDSFPNILKLNKVHITNNIPPAITPQLQQQPNENSAILEDGTDAVENQYPLSPSNLNNNAVQTRNHIISPNISNRINSLIRNTRQSITLSHPMTLRSQVMRRNTSANLTPTP